MPMLVNPNHERFCIEFVKDNNATQAAIRAGYSANAARQQGSRLLTNASIVARVAELQLETSQRAEVDADWIVRELTKIAKADIRKFYREDGTLKPVPELDDDCAAALSSMEIKAIGESGTLRKIKRWDRPKVLELLGRHLGMWPQKIQHTGVDGGPIKHSEVIAIADLAPEQREQLRMILLGTKRAAVITDVEEVEE